MTLDEAFDRMIQDPEFARAYLPKLRANARLGEAVRHTAERLIVWKDGRFHSWLKYGEHFVAETVGVALQEEKRDAVQSNQ